MSSHEFLAVATVLLAAAPLLAAGAASNTLPAEGQPAPQFSLPSQSGAQISLSSLRGKWVVLYFYPKDMTTGCTIEAHNFQNAQSQFAAKNAVILGVSVDSTESHQQFCAKDGLTFHLLSDTSHSVVSGYGSLGNNNGTAMANRNTFLITPDGNIAKVWTGVNPATAASSVLAAIPGSASVAAPAAMHAMPPKGDSVKPPGPPSGLDTKVQ